VSIHSKEVRFDFRLTYIRSSFLLRLDFIAVNNIFINAGAGRRLLGRLINLVSSVPRGLPPGIITLTARRSTSTVEVAQIAWPGHQGTARPTWPQAWDCLPIVLQVKLAGQ
jgi:hypothetical protein